jgi:basic membrane protein A and related proteins
VLQSCAIAYAPGLFETVKFVLELSATLTNTSIMAPFAPTGSLRVAVLFAGPAQDGGFMESGYRAMLRAGQATGAQTRFIDRLRPQFQDLRDGLHRLAQQGADLVIAHGGQNNEAALDAAAAWPGTMFAVTQGQVSASNLASYDVMQEQSAFLAGILAALTTQTGIVAHLSGIRVRPGLKGRAAFAHGVRHANPNVRFLTDFCGHQDDHTIAEAAARRLIGEGADRLFTMLNSGRSGAIAACRDLGCRQIGNVDDWTIRDPEVFIGSACADVGRGVERAIEDFMAANFPAGQILHIGAETDGAVRLAVDPDVKDAVKSALAQATDELSRGRLVVKTEWAGRELEF